MVNQILVFETRFLVHTTRQEPATNFSKLMVQIFRNQFFFFIVFRHRYENQKVMCPSTEKKEALNALNVVV